MKEGDFLLLELNQLMLLNSCPHTKQQQCVQIIQMIHVSSVFFSIKLVPQFLCHLSYSYI